MAPISPVRIVEVGPRDGLQNVTQSIPTKTKIELINRLHDAGCSTVEITSVVNPKAIPQLADCETVLSDTHIQKLFGKPTTRSPVLIPNVKGLDVALRHGVKEVAVFVSASEGFSKANIRCTVQEGLHRARKVADKAISHGLAVRGYISCVFACPFDGPTPQRAVLDCVRDLLDMGCYEISLGDTLGVGVPTDVESLIKHLVDENVPVERLAGHFHDTYGQAMANVWAAYRLGVRVFDSSVAGLGGCPYAPGAKGNLATEDLVYSFHQAGVDTGINLNSLVQTGNWISQQLGIPNSSRAGAALAAKANMKAQTQPATANIKWEKQPCTDELEIWRSGTNLKLVLNRPEKGNVLTASMISRITTVFADAASDPSITRIAITARGKFFCTGMDLGKEKSPVAQGGSQAEAQYDRLFRLFEAIDRAPQVTIACLQGMAFGGGVGLAFACDVRLMAEEAGIRLSEVRLGLAPATISKYVIRELGPAFSREAMLSARTVKAKELHRLGKVAAVAASTDWDGLLDRYLVGLGQCAPEASMLAKSLVRLSWEEGGGGERQVTGVREVFERMMQPGGESAYGLSQFQQGHRPCDWDAYTLARCEDKAKL